MNKYALIVPLIVLSFVAGYFSSCPPTEEGYVITIIAASLTAALTLAVGCLLFMKKQKEGWKTVNDEVFLLKTPVSGFWGENHKRRVVRKIRNKKCAIVDYQKCKEKAF